jgi:hypothetical protein
MKHPFRALFLFSVLLYFSVVAKAQTKPLARQMPTSYLKVTCVEAKRCDEKHVACPSTDQGLNTAHRLVLTPNFTVAQMGGDQLYIAECISTSSGTVCTTGKSQDDIKVFGSDTLNLLRTRIGYSFQGMFSDDQITPVSNPITVNVQGTLGSLGWVSYTPLQLTRRIIAVSVQSQPSSPYGGENEKMQNLSDAVTPASSCTSYILPKDPSGRVFDSKSLEPLSGIVVEINKKASSGASARLNLNTPHGVNPQTTGVDGAYSFSLPDGAYQLVAKDPTGSYAFPVANGAQYGAGYSAVYNNLYPSETGPDIVASGGELHTDIPMTLIEGKKFQNNPIKIESFITDLDKSTNAYTIEGEVSHPFATVNVWVNRATAQGDLTQRTRLVSSQKAGVTGKFKIKVDLTLFSRGEILGELEAIKSTNAEGSIPASAPLDSILNYIEGYAYDAKDLVLPNAIVGVYLSFSSKPSYETKSDKDGFFKISSEHLPFMAYTLKYTAENGAVTSTTPEKFIRQNLPYLTQHNVNLGAVKKDKSADIQKPTGKTQTITQNDLNNAPVILSSDVIVAILLLVAVVMIGIAVGMYLLKKSKAPDMTI